MTYRKVNDSLILLLQYDSTTHIGVEMDIGGIEYCEVVSCLCFIPTDDVETNRIPTWQETHVKHASLFRVPTGDGVAK